eukprot:SAG31_NODE_15415_length_756_cov_1.566210_2_plen_121_part_01
MTETGRQCANCVATAATNVLVCKPFSYQLRDPLEIAKLWAKPQPSSDSLVAAGKLNMAPGALLLFKDARIPEKFEVPVEDKESLGANATRFARPEAPGFRITVEASGNSTMTVKRTSASKS